MLFIDANLYLEFFKSSQASVKKLLPAIESLKDKIFVPVQIKNEVNRNKLKIASDSLREYVSSYKPPNARLPEHLEEGEEDIVGRWNKESAKLRSDVEDSQKSLSEVAELLLQKIMKGEDGASVSLNNVFETAVSASADELDKSRLRKEFGNPPGKAKDSLGDQISWEQLLSAYDGESPLWILSNDDDYSSKTNKSRILNAFLFDEVKTKLGKEPEIYVFDSLAVGIKHYSENQPEPVENLPESEELEEIAVNELKQRKVWGISRGFPDPISCYKCGASEGFNGPVARPSQFGGWSYQWFCNACHEWNDFGEPYDE